MTAPKLREARSVRRSGDRPCRVTRRTATMPQSLSELEIGFIGFALTLLIFAVQGFISVLLEGRELRPGRVRPRLTNPLSVAIVIFSGLLLVIAVFLGIGIARD